MDHTINLRVVFCRETKQIIQISNFKRKTREDFLGETEKSLNRPCSSTHDMQTQNLRFKIRVYKREIIRG